MSRGYDYVIVGGGSAGCVLAARLSEDSAARVLLLEAGGRDRNPLFHMPAGFAKMRFDKHTWGFDTTPQPHANNRKIPYSQARVLGGGSSLNAEVFTRGNPVDYDRWANEEGCEGWSYADVHRYFIRSEGNTTLSGDWHGTDGPLGVSNIDTPQPMTRAFVQSCQEAGMPYNPDFNGAAQQGAGIYQTTTRNGRRCSSAAGYLKPVMRRPNLIVETGCRVNRVLFVDNRAAGVEYERRGQLRIARAEQEIIVSSGAIGSPKLLMLSGVGPADHLREHGIEVVQDLPGVGSNLSDHYRIDTVAELTGHQSLDKYRKPHWAMWAGLQYALFGTGPVASNIVEGGAFWFGGRTAMMPDLQFHFMPAAGTETCGPGLPRGSSGVTLNSYALRPKARGTVRLRSDKVSDAPLVDPNFLGHPDDLKTSVEGVRISLDILRQKTMQKHIRQIRFPDDTVKTQADFEAYARQYGCTSFHPSCTCKMGTDDMAVVDPQLRVHGIDGLRICDTSAMPSLIGSNTNAPTIMMAEKASDMIRGNR